MRGPALPRWLQLTAFLAGGLTAAAGEYVAHRRLSREERILLAITTAFVVVGAYWGGRALWRIFTPTNA